MVGRSLSPGRVVYVSASEGLKEGTTWGWQPVSPEGAAQVQWVTYPKPVSCGFHAVRSGLELPAFSRGFSALWAPLYPTRSTKRRTRAWDTSLFPLTARRITGESVTRMVTPFKSITQSVQASTPAKTLRILSVDLCLRLLLGKFFAFAYPAYGLTTLLYIRANGLRLVQVPSPGGRDLARLSSLDQR